MTHAVEQLWARHAPERPYPKGVVAVPRPIPGIAFFPGGYGLWRPNPKEPLPPLPVGGTMVLGHDFHSAAGYRASFRLGREPETQPTWRNLLALFERAGIDPRECFFTNVYMGLRAGRATTGPFPGASDTEFVAHCLSFLADQLAAQRPSLVITLGVNVPPLLAQLSEDLADWRLETSIKHLDSTGPLRLVGGFAALPGFHTTVAALIHPSLRHASIRYRRYKNFSGDEAEVALLKDAVLSRVRAV